MSHSRIYEGWVRHRRFQPVHHQLRYRLFMLYLDLEELPDLFDPYWLWSARRPALAWFRRTDHVGDPQRELSTTIRNLVEDTTGKRPRGPVRLLTHLRYYGYCMNPVSFYYCWDAQDQTVDAIVAEIHNTPWGERHCYVLEGTGEGRSRMSYRFDKEFHVSPFMQMDVEYQWNFTSPGEKLAVHMENLCQDRKIFDATMSLEARPLEARSLRRVLFRYPWMTGKVIGAIYWNAFLLWMKRSPFYEHPKHQKGNI